MYSTEFPGLCLIFLSYFSLSVFSINLVSRRHFQAELVRSLARLGIFRWCPASCGACGTSASATPTDGAASQGIRGVDSAKWTALAGHTAVCCGSQLGLAFEGANANNNRKIWKSCKAVPEKLAGKSSAVELAGLAQGVNEFKTKKTTGRFVFCPFLF